MNRTLIEAIVSHARSTPEKPAVILKNTVLTYAELVLQIKRAALILREQYGIAAGDRVMISGLSKPEYLVIFFGVQYLHATTVPLDKVWLEDTVLKLYDFIRPKLMITDMVFHREGLSAVSMRGLYKDISDGASVAEIPYAVPGMDEIAEMLFTTGTTGTPKGAMLTYGNICSITNNNIEGVGILSSDIVLDALPLCHSLGLREARMTLYVGATLVIQNGFTFRKELRTNILDLGCTGFVCVPATIEQLTRQVEDFSDLFSHFRYMEIGAGSLSYDLKKRLPLLLPNTEIYNTWGSSETGGVIFLDVKNRQDKLTALGKPVQSAKIKVVGPDGQEIIATDIDNAGRLAVKGDMTMAGYYQKPEVNAETLVDGWLLTNDLVYTDGEGFVYMLGRADDIINVGGEKVSPIEIENIASEFEKVTDAACIGVKDDIMGQVPVLYVAVEEPYKEEDLLRFLTARLESFKVPKQIIRVQEIPRNRMKKLDRKAVRKLWDERGKNTYNDVIGAIMSRHSCRNFTDQRIERGVLETLVKAGIQAPTGHNLQTWRFTVITNKELIAQIKEIGSFVAKREKKTFYGFNNPDALILISADKRNDTGVLDAACAAENIMLAAHSLGLGACWLNGLMRIQDQDEIQALLGRLKVPDTHVVCSMIALGYPANESKSPVRKENVIEWLN